MKVQLNVDNKELVARFNARFPVGSKVRWRELGREDVPFREYTVAVSAFMAYGDPVVFFSDRPGYHSIEEEYIDYSE